MKKAKRPEDRMTEVLKGLTEKQWDKFGSFDDLYNHVFKVMRKSLLKEKDRKK
jgi:hypothetical protein